MRYYTGVAYISGAALVSRDNLSAAPCGSSSCCILPCSRALPYTSGSDALAILNTHCCECCARAIFCAVKPLLGLAGIVNLQHSERKGTYH